MIKLNFVYPDTKIYAIYYLKDKKLYRNSKFDGANKEKVILWVCDDLWLSE